MSNWSLYILRCGDGTLYTGIATDVSRRLDEHQSQGPKAAKYTRSRLPLTIVYQRELGSRSEASKEEFRIKSLTRDQKLALIEVECDQIRRLKKLRSPAEAKS